MTVFQNTVRFLSVVALMLLGTGAVRAGSSGVQDNAGFFSEPARAEASRIIADVDRTLRKNILVETFNTVPDNARNGADLADKAAASQFFRQWAESQARQSNVNGVYILLVKQPAHLQVVIGNQTSKQAFTIADRDALVAKMLANLRAKKNDAALLDGVNFIATTMRSHLTNAGHSAVAAPGSGGGFGSGWLMPVLIGGGVLWLLIALVRSMFGGRANPIGSGSQPELGGGGGFMRSMLGGLFGAAAGMWMYNQFFGSQSHAAPPSDGGNSGFGDTGYSGQDTDYTSSGGDFGDSGFGGGDSGFGGGDFGGGDSGGGGEF